MPFKISPCDDVDIPLVFAIISTALGPIPYMNALYPGHNEPSGREIGAKRMLDLKRTDPHSHFIKAVDTSSGEIVGVAEWILYNGNVPEELGMEGDYWNSMEDKSYANCLWKSYLAPRRQMIKETDGRLVCKQVPSSLLRKSRRDLLNCC